MILLSSLLLTLPLGQAQPPGPVSLSPSTDSGLAVVQDDDPADLLEDILDEYQSTYSTFLTAYRGTEDQAERQRLIAEEMPDPADYAQRILDLVDKHPGSDVAWDGLNWIVAKVRGGTSGSDALLRLMVEFPKDERLGDLCLRTTRGPFSEAVVEALANLAESSPHEEVRGRATFALGMQYKGLANAATDEAGREALNKSCLEVLRLVVKKFPDVPASRGTLGAAAAAELFEIERLQIGMEAPDIEANDIDGVSFKLSDYRGKVVVIDFWGHW